MKKILIIRFSSIGDIVLTSPVIRCIKTQLKNVEVHYLTKKTFSSLLENNPYVDKVHTINETVSEVINALAKENFDFVIDLHHNLRSLQVKRKLKKPTSSFEKLNIEKWLMVHLKINRLPTTHIVDRYLAATKHLHIVNDGKGLDYFIPQKDEVYINTLPPTHRTGYIGFVIGAAHATKQLPTEKIISICKKINQPIILLGGKEDLVKGEKIKKEVGEMVFNACNLYNINQSASLVKQATQIITHDTGLMHIAAAFQKKIISVWGNTIPEFGMSPYFGTTSDERTTSAEKVNSNTANFEPRTPNSVKVEVKNLSCRPCSKIGFAQCPKKHFKCMNDIQEEDIVAVIKN